MHGITLKPHQEMAKEFLLTHPHSCLFFEAGSGKTFPTIEAIIEVCKSPEDKALIISTKAVIDGMWKKDIKSSGYKLPEKTLMINMERIVGKEYQEALLSTKWKVVVFDECHRIKAHNTKISKLMQKLTKVADYSWGLTGTPIGNTEIDIFNIFKNLSISKWKNMSYSSFVETCCDLEIGYGPFGQFKKPKGIKQSYRTMFDEIVNEHSIRCRLEDVVEMPPMLVKQQLIHYIPTTQYKDAMNGILKMSDEETTMNKIVAILKAHQAVNGYLYYPDEKGGSRYEIFEKNKKINWLESNIKPEEKVIIVYRFKADRDMIYEAFNISNDVTDNKEEFIRGSKNILLLQCGKAEGLNLQFCNKMIFYSLDYSYLKFNQMIHRIYRVGQKQECEIIILLHSFKKENSNEKSKPTIEENIWHSVCSKEKVADLFMDIKGGNNG